MVFTLEPSTATSMASSFPAILLVAGQAVDISLRLKLDNMLNDNMMSNKRHSRRVTFDEDNNTTHYTFPSYIYDRSYSGQYYESDDGEMLQYRRPAVNASTAYSMM